MTGQIPRPFGPDNSRAVQDGCTAPGCGTQDTEWLDPRVGRRCAAHAPEFDAAPAATTPSRTEFPA